MDSRPKVGLALSGGGARGFAHIGVLRWFEEHRIPVDYLAGTSMGGLVGGMYAIGMTPEQLRKLPTSINWTDLFRPVPAYDSLDFRRKEDRREFPNHLELGLKGGLKIPTGLNSGHSIGLLLGRLTLPYSRVESFDDLPIPFRCLATDMVEAKQIVLDHGSLPIALQATMAIPGVFSPIEMDGKILASDGGLLNNVPTDVTEQMGPDVVIAVDIGTPLAKREELNSLGGVLSQTIGVMMNESIKRNLDPNLHPKLKVIIAPELKEFTTFDFKSANEIIELGYQGAEAKATELLKYAVSEEEWQRHIQARRARMKEVLPVPEFVKVTGVSAHEEKNISGVLQKHLNKPVDTSAIAMDLNRIWGQGRYAGLSYSLIEEEGKPGLQINVREKSYAPPILNIGLELDNTETEIFDFNLRGRVTMFDLLTTDSELRLDASIGSRILIGAEYYNLLGSTHFFVAPYAYYNRTKKGFFFDGEEVAQYQINRSQLGVDLGYTFGTVSQVRLGYEIGNLDASRSIGNPILPDLSGKTSSARAQWVLDSTDSPVVATHGSRISMTTRWVFDTPILENLEADSSFGQAQGRIGHFFPFGSKNTLVLSGEAGTTFSGSASLIEKFSIGGLFRVSGLSRDEFHGDHLLYGGLTYLRKIGQLPPIVGEKISIGAWYEIGTVYDEWDDADSVQSISAGLIAETFLGPIFIGASYGEGNRTNFYFAIGRFF